MGRTTQQNTAATVKAIAGATIQKGDLLYSDPVNYNVLPVSSSAMTASFYNNVSLVKDTVLNSDYASTIKAGNTSLSNGDYVYAYADGSNVVKFARYNSSGVLQGAITTVDTGAGQVYSINITPLNNGGFAIGWTNGTVSVKAAIYNASGTQTVAPFVVEAVNSSTSGIALTTLNNNNFVIAYANSTTAARYAIYSDAGVSVLAPTNSNGVNTTGYFNGISVAAISDGGFVIAMKSGTSGLAIWKYNSAGTYVTQSTVSTYATTVNIKVLNAGEDNIIVIYSHTSQYLQVARYKNDLSRIAEPSSEGNNAALFSYNPTIFIDTFDGNATASNIPDAYSVDAAYNSVNKKIIIVLRSSSKLYYGVFDRTAKLENGWQLLNSLSNYPSVAINNTGFQIVYLSSINNYPNFIVNSLTLTANTTYSFPPTTVDGTSSRANKPTFSIQCSMQNTYAGQSKSISLNNGHVMTAGKCNSSFDNSWMTIYDIYGNVKLSKIITNLGGTGNGGATSIDLCVLSNGNIAIATQQQTSSTSNRGVVYIYDQNGNPVLTSPITVFTSGSSNPLTIRVAAFNDGQFAVAYNDSSSYIAGQVYTNNGVQVGSTINSVISQNFSNASGQTFNMAVTTNNNIVIIGQNAATGVTYTVKTRDFSTTITSNSNYYSFTANPGMHHEVIATSDGGWIWMFATSTSPWTIEKYNANGQNISGAVSLPTGFATNIAYGRLSLDSQGNLYIATKSSGVYQVLKYSPSLTLITTYSFPTDPAAPLQVAFSKNAATVAFPVNNANIGIGYVLYETLVVGIAAESGTIGQTIDMALDGIVDLRENWLPATANYLSSLPSGIKGSIYGFTAELTRQRNNLG